MCAPENGCEYGRVACTAAVAQVSHVRRVRAKADNPLKGHVPDAADCEELSRSAGGLTFGWRHVGACALIDGIGAHQSGPFKVTDVAICELATARYP